VIGLLLAVAFIDYEPAQTEYVRIPALAKNAVGWIGADISFICFSWLGVAAWFIPGGLFWVTYNSIRNAKQVDAARLCALLACLFSGAALAAMFATEVHSFENDYFTHDLGGHVGGWIYRDVLSDPLGGFGSGVVLGLVYFLSLLFILTADFGAELEKALQSIQGWWAERKERQMQAKKEEDEFLAEQKKRKVDAAKTPPAPVPVAKLEIAKDPSPPPARSPFAKPETVYPLPPPAPETAPPTPARPEPQAPPPPKGDSPPLPPFGGFDLGGNREPRGLYIWEGLFIEGGLCAKAEVVGKVSIYGHFVNLS
jgi:hypothetical protein